MAQFEEPHYACIQHSYNELLWFILIIDLRKPELGVLKTVLVP